MVSLFAIIMALGVIVDDSIVVGEDAFAHFQTGERSLLAAEGGAQRMLAPVTAASLTTIAAFLPLMMISGIMGNILFDIPLVMICVLIASLVECFLVLPGHLRHSFHKMQHEKPSRIRQKLDNAFNHFRDFYFLPVVSIMISFRWSVIATMLATMLLAIGLLAGGRMSFTFFPSPENTMLMANVNFVAGTSPKRVDAFLEHLEKTLYATDKALGGNLVKVAVIGHGQGIAAHGATRTGEQFGSLLVELSSPDHRTVRNKHFIKAWESRIRYAAGIESLSILERKGGPPGRDIEIRLNGENAEKVKKAALEVVKVLKTFPGVSSIEDDMPYGREQWIYSLTDYGMALGLTVESVGQQLRAAFEGNLVQIFQDANDEIEVRVMLPDYERYNLALLDDFSLKLPNGSSIPFSTAVKIRTQRGFEAIRHAEGILAAQVTAEVDSAMNNNNQILAQLKEKFLPELSARYGV